MDDEGIRDIADVIKTEKPLFGEGEDPSMLECGGSVNASQVEASLCKKSTSGAGASAAGSFSKRSDKFAHLEAVRQEMEKRK